MIPETDPAVIVVVVAFQFSMSEATQVGQNSKYAGKILPKNCHVNFQTSVIG